jgi:hypothetical protein
MHVLLSSRQGGRARPRRGAASLDYVLILGIILPMAAFALWAGPRIMNLVYEMTSVLVTWPFM